MGVHGNRARPLRSLLVGVTVFLSVLLGCVSTSTLSSGSLSVSPPSYDFILKNQEHGAKELGALTTASKIESWWKGYRLGLLNLEKNPNVSCTHFTALSKEESFPLKDIALLRAHQTCDNDKDLAPLDYETGQTTYRYSRDLLAFVRLKEARLTKEKNDDVEALLEVSHQESIQKNKEQPLMEALKIATEQGESQKVDEINQLLYKIAPRLNPAPTTKELAAVAMDYRQHRQFDRALAAYRQIYQDSKSSREEKFQSLKNIRMTHKIAQNKNDYIEATTDLLNKSKSAFKKYKKDPVSIKQLHESYILLARTLWTEDRLQLAHQTLVTAQRQLKGLHSFDEIYFILGRMAEEKGDLQKASSYYEASGQERLSAPAIRDRVLWLHPWVLYKMKDYEKSAKMMQDFSQRAKDPSDRARALFWLARSLNSLNKTEESKEILKQLVKEDPIGYYGVLAVRELRQEFPILKSNEKDFSYSFFNLKEIPQSFAQQTEWLIAVGESSIAQKIIDETAEQLKRKNRSDESAWMVVLTSYARANLYLPLFAAFGGLPQELKEALVSKHPELLFPRNFHGLITQSASNENIPAEIAFSIIRQESAFNPRARSPVDAFGLMQLLPSIAKNLSRTLDVPYKEAEDLFDPEINIPLGTREIKNLLTKYDQQYILAVSAYNASDSAIRGWLKTRYRSDALEFIEEVPYDETRSYIKLVLRNFVFYKRLNQSEAPTQFPEEWLYLVSK